ncbi:hypothetical protein LCGC14_2536100, partial [marine sediment metagenome]
MRTIARLLIATILFSTTASAADSIRTIGMTVPSPPTVLEPEATIDWMAATTLPALPEIPDGEGESKLQLDDNIVAEDGQVVPSLSPQLIIPSSLKGPSFNYVVATAPSVAGESSPMFESGTTDQRSWQVFSNLLEQGKTYYWKAVDLNSGDSTDWASFTVDIHRQGIQSTDAIGPLSVGLASGELSSAAGTVGVPTVAGQMTLALSYSSARHDSTLVSPGWSLAGLSNLGYTKAHYSENRDAITLRSVSGSSLTFVQATSAGVWQAATQGDAPAGLAGSLTVNESDEIIYTTTSGQVSLFNAQGNLYSMYTAGSGSDAQWQLQWNGDYLT